MYLQSQLKLKPCVALPADILQSCPWIGHLMNRSQVPIDTGMIKLD
jgi:hypothetical protein